MLPFPPVMLITGGIHLQEECAIVQALQGGCRWVLLRAPEADDKALLEAALRYKKLCADFQAKLFISRNTKIANAVEADGLHLSAQQTITDARAMCGDRIIGQSCHDEDELRRAIDAGANYITLSPIYQSISKPEYNKALGIETLARLSEKFSVPILALGGVTAERAIACRNAGAKGVAVTGGVFLVVDPKSEMQRLCRVFQG